MKISYLKFYLKFVYDPKTGFIGSLKKDQKNFQCKGYYNGVADSQGYELKNIGKLLSFISFLKKSGI